MSLLTGVNKQEVLKYLGYRGGELSDEYKEKIDSIAETIMKTAEPKACSVILKIENHAPLEFENAEIVLGGEDIKKHLATSDECMFMAASLGGDIDRLIKKYSATDMEKAVIADACASAAIENVCDNYVRRAEEAYNKKGLYLTDRFSPGYGDMPLESQRIVCDVTQCAKSIGLLCTRTMILEPTKSVTALVGISDKVQQKRREGCENCRLFFDCQFRKRGVLCYEQVEG